MGCCGSNRGSAFGEVGGGQAGGIPIGEVDGIFAALHPSWMDATAQIDTLKIPAGVERVVVDGVVTITINPGPNQYVIRDTVKPILTVKRQMLWGMYPGLAESIALPAPTPPVVTPPTPKTTGEPK